jgi:uncharacterized membrane protein YkgB
MHSCIPKGIMQACIHITCMHITVPLMLLEPAGPALSDNILFDILFVVNVNHPWLSFFYSHSCIDLYMSGKQKKENKNLRMVFPISLLDLS